MSLHYVVLHRGSILGVFTVMEQQEMEECKKRGLRTLMGKVHVETWDGAVHINREEFVKQEPLIQPPTLPIPTSEK